MIKKYSILFFLLPLFLRWLLPSSLELKLVVDILGFPFFFPDISYFIGLFNLKSSLNVPIHIRFSFFLLLLCSLIGMFVNEYNERLYYIFGSQWFFLALYMIMYKRLYLPIPYSIKLLTIVVFIILGLEVILYSVGILQYEGIGSNELSGIMRISTTIGAPTGTSCILLMLGGLIFTRFIEEMKYKYMFFIFWVVVILITNSRGSIFALLIFSGIYYWRLFNSISISKKIGLLFLLLGSYYCIENTSVYNAFVERMDLKQQSNEFDSGRLIRIDDTLSKIEGNEFFGVGNGNVFAAKELRTNFPSIFQGAPHNFYIVFLAEQGFIGFLFFLIILVGILRLLFVGGFDELTILLFLIFLIPMNTESIFIHNEYLMLLALMILLRLNEIKALRYNT